MLMSAMRVCSAVINRVQTLLGVMSAGVALVSGSMLMGAPVLVRYISLITVFFDLVKILRININYFI